MMQVNEVRCKSLLNRSRLADYCINPYIGCGHGCRYCYAESYTRRFTKHREQWGQFVDAKINAPQILEREIQKRPKGEVYLSSLTDAYQPLEAEYGLTRRILKILLSAQFPISIQTKSSLVLRDLDILSEFDTCHVGFTITSLDQSITEIFEPQASTVTERLHALEKLREKGISTYAFFGPILPLLSDRSLYEYFQTLANLNVDYVYVDKLNLKPGLWDMLENTVRAKYPQLLDQWQNILRSKDKYYSQLQSTIMQICKEKNLECRMCF